MPAAGARQLSENDENVVLWKCRSSMAGPVEPGR